MNKSVNADLNLFIKHLIMALKPIAKAEAITLSFSMPPKATMAVFSASTLAHDCTHIICKLIELTPEQEKISVSIHKINDQSCKVVIENSGINTSRVNEITRPCKFPITTIENVKNSTQYEITVNLHNEQPNTSVDGKISEPNFIKKYYQDVKTRFNSHFTVADNLLEKLSEQNPREASFLKKVNHIVLENIENSQFDTNQLSEVLNMSRTQLFRKLKPIVLQSPGNYVRTIRLYKAKELFETTNLRISEVAYKTGFETASHFTKSFTKQFGVKPSLFCKNRRR